MAFPIEPHGENVFRLVNCSQRGSRNPEELRPLLGCTSLFTITMYTFSLHHIRGVRVSPFSCQIHFLKEQNIIQRCTSTLSLLSSLLSHLALDRNRGK
ncbi:hypothetical protein GDO81_002987 [Engystomops pustulosus]|uniref:Uncharacterized protein n=1 Tax=Engystomops pustulosus TaxID=76066 RepID=A0AAV7DRR6_ENGPU|nr:hypothetical protein GDO81_002987 [Engystomops pustulosus]